jgi:tetratricopeptide (TPR) repeat protein
MVDLRPDLSSYARVSYARELYGDRAGAIAAMEQAAVAGAGRAENVAWTQAQLGNLHFDGGELDAAQAAYETALRTLPGYVYGLAGLGKVAAARGDFPTAITHYQDAIQTMPLPEFVIALGDILSVSGDSAGAEQQYALVEAMQELYRTNGVDTDLEMALFEADHAERVIDFSAVVTHARDAYERRPSVKAADVLAWTLYQAGDLDGAWAASVEARRLGTQDALMRYHAGMIALARGDNATASTLLNEALAINPNFSVRYASQARGTLARISNS